MFLSNILLIMKLIPNYLVMIFISHELTIYCASAFPQGYTFGQKY